MAIVKGAGLVMKAIIEVILYAGSVVYGGVNFTMIGM